MPPDPDRDRSPEAGHPGGAFQPRPRAGRDPAPRFGPDRTALFPVLVLLVCTIPTVLIGGWALVLLLLPLLCALWVLRARVVVRPSGLEVSNGLGVRRVPWERVEGFDVPPRGPVRLLAAGGRVPLTAVPRRRVRELVAASERATRGPATQPGSAAP